MHKPLVTVSLDSYANATHSIAYMHSAGTTVGIICVQTVESQDYFSKWLWYVNKYDFRSAAHGDCCDCLCDVNVH